MINTGQVLALKKLIFQCISLLTLIEGPHHSAHIQMFLLLSDHVVLAEKLLSAPQVL